jgi:hypothetical protein
MEQQQTMFPFENEAHRDLVLPLEAEQQQRLIELMAQAIEAVVQHAQQGEDNDRS